MTVRRSLSPSLWVTTTIETLAWAPRDLRHTFASLMSADGIQVEEIAGWLTVSALTTELVYRREWRPLFRLVPTS
jgi:integrase